MPPARLARFRGPLFQKGYTTHPPLRPYTHTHTHRLHICRQGFEKTGLGQRVATIFVKFFGEEKALMLFPGSVLITASEIPVAESASLVPQPVHQPC